MPPATHSISTGKLEGYPNKIRAAKPEAMDLAMLMISLLSFCPSRDPPCFRKEPIPLIRKLDNEYIVDPFETVFVRKRFQNG